MISRCVAAAREAGCVAVTLTLSRRRPLHIEVKDDASGAANPVLARLSSRLQVDREDVGAMVLRTRANRVVVHGTGVQACNVHKHTHCSNRTAHLIIHMCMYSCSTRYQCAYMYTKHNEAKSKTTRLQIPFLTTLYDTCAVHDTTQTVPKNVIKIAHTVARYSVS